MLYYPPPEHTTDLLSHGSVPRRPGRPRKSENVSVNEADMQMRVSCIAPLPILLFPDHLVEPMRQVCVAAL